MNPNIFIIVVVVLVLLWILTSMIRIVNQYDRLVIFSLGRYAGTRGPGVVFVIPFVERAVRMDTRERFLEIPRQTVISKDNTTINIDFLMYYRIVDPALAVIQVDDVFRASLNVAATTLRAIIGDIELDDVLAKREQINDLLRVKLDEITERWGLKVTRVEIREVEPPRDVQEAMNRQMSAERERRATVTRAEGERSASITVAEGEKQSAILRAEGMKQAAILTAEGERQAQLLRAQGFAAGLHAVDEQSRDLDVNTLTLQYLDMLRGIGSSPSTKFVIPMEVVAMVQQLAGVFGTPRREHVASSGANNGTNDGSSGA